MGISTVPYKVCSFDCVYCQLKKTTEKTTQRKKYIPLGAILEEIRTFFVHNPDSFKIDYITLSGSGEPTLYGALGALIKEIRLLTKTPIALLTNSSTMTDPKVRREMQGVDLIIPSLDAVTQDIFEKIDRPLLGMRIEDIIVGLLKFKNGFKGRMWLEIMLVRGLNDSSSYLKKMKKIVDRINPERVQINVPVRLPSENWVKLPFRSTLKKARGIFGENCDIV